MSFLNHQTTVRQMRRWASIALANLFVVAALGLLLRIKLILPVKTLPYTHVLHAHSHFAFAGWVSLGLLSMMTYQLLPVSRRRQPRYGWLLSGLLFSALGMLVGFLVQGYGAVSIAFSTSYILIGFVYTGFFTRDFRRAGAPAPVRLLAYGALACMVLSALGPTTLAWLMATKTGNPILYKNAVYTYLHLQYNGFFTLAVCALLLDKLQLSSVAARRFAYLLLASVLPAMFISYLWSYPGSLVQTMAALGSLLSLISLMAFFALWPDLRQAFRSRLDPFAARLFQIALAAFVLKMILQVLSVIPSIGELVFFNRPVVIGFLHLVLLGCITHAFLGFFVESRVLRPDIMTRRAVRIFFIGFLANELALTAQGFGHMFMVTSSVYPWLLLAAAACLFTGAGLILLCLRRLRPLGVIPPTHPAIRIRYRSTIKISSV